MDDDPWRNRLVTALLQRAAELLHKRLAVLWAGAISGLADLGETGPAVLINDPFSGNPVAERDGAAGDRTRDQGNLVDRDTDVATCWRKIVQALIEVLVHRLGVSLS